MTFFRVSWSELLISIAKFEVSVANDRIFICVLRTVTEKTLAYIYIYQKVCFNDPFDEASH